MTDVATPAPALTLTGEAAQLAFGARLAGALAGRAGIVYLRGDLGAGKTTLVRGLLRALGHSGPVRSPTFTLIEPYDDLTPPIQHLDLYRVADPEELLYLGLTDLLDGRTLLLVEWPERGAGVLPPPDLAIDIAYAGESRRVRVQAAAGWEAVAAALASADEPAAGPV